MVQNKLKQLLENIINEIEKNELVTMDEIVHKMFVQIKNENLIN